MNQKFQNKKFRLVNFLLEFVHGNKGNNPNNFKLWFSCSNVFTFVLLHTKRTKENKRNITGTKDGYLQKFSNNRTIHKVQRR